MSVMTRREAIAGLLAMVAARPLRAQSELDFLRDLADFADLGEMLPRALLREASFLLERRRRAGEKVSTQAQVDERRAYIRHVITRAVGAFPARTPLNPRLVGALEGEGFKIEKILFESRPRFYVTANLYLPTAGAPPYPGVLYPLGHEAGGKSHETWQRMLISLARRGYVALTWDPLGQGERAQMYDEDFEERKLVRSTTEHTMLGVQCLLAGDNLAQYMLWDAIRALDYLLSRPEVDDSRIACTGNSGGGMLTAYLAALEDRIHVAAPSCYLTSWRQLLETIGPQDAEQVLLPFLAAGLDHADFIYAFAPRPYLMLSAIRDFFSITGARATYAEAVRLYEMLGAREKISMSEVDAGHGYHKHNREAAYNWLSRWLEGTEDPTPEPELEIAAEEELRCTATGQVASSLGGETVHTLNRQRVAALATKLPAIGRAADVAAYRREIGNRVRRISGLEYEPGAPDVRPYGRIDRSGYHIEKLTYQSEPGIVVPSLLCVPAGAAARPAVVYVHSEGKAADAAVDGEIEWYVRRGHVVLAIDVRGMGETRRVDERNGSDFPRYFGDYASAMTSFLVGRSLVGMRAVDVLRAVDLLQSRSEVDPDSIHGVGKGDGAVPLLYAAALDDRLRKLAFERMLVSYRAVVQHQIHRGVLEAIVPGALQQFDLPDLIASLIPRTVWIVNPVNPLGNRLVPDAAVKAYAEVSGGYRRAGAAGAITVARREDGEAPGAIYGPWLSAS